MFTKSKVILREKLAEYAHAAWSGWMKYMFSKSTKNAGGSMTIPAWLVERWTRQMNTPYTELPEGEKKSDRNEADIIIGIMKAISKEDAILCDSDMEDLMSDRSTDA